MGPLFPFLRHKSTPFLLTFSPDDYIIKTQTAQVCRTIFTVRLAAANRKKRELKFMVLLIESLILCALFTLPIIIASKNPITMIHDYPPAIIEKVRELGLIDETQTRKSKKSIIKKSFAAIQFVFLLAAAVRYANGADSFGKGFFYAYILWTIVNWYDVIFMDIIWFCHDKRYIIPGTEGMKEYKDYMFHIKGGFIGMLYGLPVALIVGTIVAVLN